MNQSDVFAGMERFDVLKAEFDTFRHARGAIKLHGTKYLTVMLIDITARIRILELTTDDDYGSVAAALTLWRDYRSRVVKFMQDKK